MERVRDGQKTFFVVYLTETLKGHRGAVCQDPFMLLDTKTPI